MEKKNLRVHEKKETHLLLRNTELGGVDGARQRLPVALLRTQVVKVVVERGVPWCERLELDLHIVRWREGTLTIPQCRSK